MNNHQLIIFIKNPVRGKAKTRLAATIGPDKALAVYQLLLQRTRSITQTLFVDKVLYYADFIPVQDDWDPAIYQKQQQTEGDLGARMLQAFTAGFAEDYKAICIIGSDCYELSKEILEQAFQQLSMHDVVIGPSEDGGYYLLGMNKLHPALFAAKHWSSDSVFLDTLKNCRELELSVALLPALTDIDEEKDLHTIPNLKLS